MRCYIESNDLGMLSLERVTSIPHVKSLQRSYYDQFKIDLVSAIGEEKSWILPWAHMLAACAQIQTVTREHHLASIFPKWLQTVCGSIISRYGSFSDSSVEDLEDVCNKRGWLVDRMLLSSSSSDDASSSSSEDNGGASTDGSTSKDLVVLQVITFYATNM